MKRAAACSSPSTSVRNRDERRRRRGGVHEYCSQLHVALRVAAVRDLQVCIGGVVIADDSQAVPADGDRRGVSDKGGSLDGHGILEGAAAVDVHAVGRALLGLLVGPVQLMVGHACRLAVLDGLGPAGLVAAPVLEDLVSEHDHMVVSGAEVCVPAAFG